MGQFDFKYSRTITSPVKAYISADFDFNNHNLGVILNSRQSKTPVGDDKWVQGTNEAVSQAIQSGYTLITSIGLNTWELTLWACSKQNGFQIVICPLNSFEMIPHTVKSVIADFNLNPGRTGWLFFESTDKKSPKKDWQIRDELAIYSADIFIPVSLRPQSNLQLMIEPYLADKGRQLIGDIKTGYHKPIYQHQHIPKKPGDHLAGLKWDYITHWTRSCNGSMPGQFSHDYYQQITNSQTVYCNHALNVLKNILIEKSIRASSNNLPANLSAVAFTINHPKQMLKLMRWRKRLVNWNFEPYGIAIRTKAAVKQGIKEVIYGDKNRYDQLTEKQKRFFQNTRGEKSDWQTENEWRHIGNIDLNIFSSDDIRIIVSNPSEIEKIKSYTESKIISFT